MDLREAAKLRSSGRPMDQSIISLWNEISYILDNNQSLRMKIRFLRAFSLTHLNEIFSRVLRDSMTRYVGRLVGLSVCLSHLVFFWRFWASFALLLLLLVFGLLVH